MEIDVLTTLEIVAQQGASEFQRILMYVCLSALAVFIVGACFGYIDKVARDIFGKFKRLGLINSLIIACIVIPIIMYGGSKKTPVKHPGGDVGLQVVGIYADLTNEVVEVGITNTYTDVTVEFLGTIVAQTTPVWVRMSETNEWTELVKMNPTIYYDGVTNHLDFGVSGDVKVYPWWWVGDDTPAIHIETTGITITYFLASSQSIAVTWECKYPRATTFVVQYRNGPQDEWHTVLETEAKNALISGFFINRTTQWRISSTYTEGN